MTTTTVVQQKNSLSTISLVLGILTFIPGCLLSIFGSAIGLAAIITGVIALTQISRDKTTGQTQAIIGIVLGGVGALIAPFAGIAILMILGPSIGNTFSTINSSLSGY